MIIIFCLLFQFDQAHAQSLALMRVLNQYLLTQTYFVGERLTLADIALALSLKPVFENLLEESTRKELVNLTRWFNTVVNQSAVGAGRKFNEKCGGKVGSIRRIVQ